MQNEVLYTPSPAFSYHRAHFYYFKTRFKNIFIHLHSNDAENYKSIQRSTV